MMSDCHWFPGMEDGLTWCLYIAFLEWLVKGAQVGFHEQRNVVGLHLSIDRQYII